MDTSFLQNQRSNWRIYRCLVVSYAHKSVGLIISILGTACCHPARSTSTSMVIVSDSCFIRFHDTGISSITSRKAIMPSVSFAINLEEVHEIPSTVRRRAASGVLREVQRRKSLHVQLVNNLNSHFMATTTSRKEDDQAVLRHFYQIAQWRRAATTPTLPNKSHSKQHELDLVHHHARRLQDDIDQSHHSSSFVNPSLHSNAIASF
jgi:hypothetical protein